MKKLYTTILITIVLTGVFAPFSFNVVKAQDVPNPNDTTSNSDNLKDAIGCTSIASASITSCMITVLYYLAYAFPSWLLGVSANFFNALAGLTLSSSLYAAADSFLSAGWGIVRDMANIIFIFVLLYIAIGTILQLHSVNTKKMLASVIIIALFINFSFFITRVVIDASNALALLFYNQMSFTYSFNSDGTKQNTTYEPIINSNISGVKEQDIGGLVAASFKPQILGSKEFLDKFRESSFNLVNGFVGGLLLAPFGPAGFLAGTLIAGQDTEVPTSILVSIILVSGAVFCYAAWAFFVAGLSFLGRLLQLWILIIFAPLAFVTYVIPFGSLGDDMNWKGWWKKLFSTAFAAPIFMFFMYLIALLSKASLLALLNPNVPEMGWLPTLLLIIIPMLIVLGMLTKAVEYAKKGSGQLGEMAFKAGSAVLGAGAGLALGVATGGIALGAQRVIGGRAQKTLNDEGLKDTAAGRITAQTRAQLGHLGNDDAIKNSAEFQRMQANAKNKLLTAQKNASRSFDIRQNPVGQAFSNATGINMGGFGKTATGNLAGGIAGATARQAEKDRKFGELLGHNEEEYRQRSEELDTRKRDVETAQDLKTRLQQERQEQNQIVQNMKDLGAPGAPRAIAARRRIDEIDAQISGANNYIDHIKNGGDTGVVPGLQQRNYEGTIAQNEKAVENIKKARAKEYFSSQMKKSGYQYHGESRDQFGNVNRLGHVNTDVISGNGLQSDQYMRRLTRAVAQGMKKGALAGGAVGLTGGVLGGVGVVTAIPTAITGAIVGGVAGLAHGGILKPMQGMFKDLGRRIDTATIPGINIKLNTDLAGGKIFSEGTHIASDDTHKIHSVNSKYKPPKSKFFDAFKGLGKSSGGGGGDSGHDSHGADHGGGGGHH